MKRFESMNGSVMFVGSAKEVKALAGSLRRAERRTAHGALYHIPGTHRTNIAAMYLEPPIFNDRKVYGLEIVDGKWLIHSPSTVLEILDLV